MVKLEVKCLKSINGVNFSTEPTAIHKALGNDFKRKKNKEISSYEKDFMKWVDEQFSQMSGKPVEEFSKYDKLEEFDSDNSDYYSFCRIDYDDNNKFEAIEVYSDQQIELIIDGIDYSDFDLEKFLTLAKDFVWSEDGTAWTSLSKQIGIWCPNGDEKVETILFGRPEYYKN